MVGAPKIIAQTGQAWNDQFTPSTLQPDFNAIASFTKRLGIIGLHVFGLFESGSSSLASARNFDPADDIDEECATGTSNGALLCYLREHQALPEQATYRIEQGEAMSKLSYIYATFQGDRVWIGGYATPGELLQ